MRRRLPVIGIQFVPKNISLSEEHTPEGHHFSPTWSHRPSTTCTGADGYPATGDERGTGRAREKVTGRAGSHSGSDAKVIGLTSEAADILCIGNGNLNASSNAQADAYPR